MSTNNNWDHLKMLDKCEIIEFLKAEFFLQAPFRQSVVSFRYQTKLGALIKTHLALLKGPDFAKALPEIKVVEKKMQDIQKWYEKNSEF